MATVKEFTARASDHLREILLEELQGGPVALTESPLSVNEAHTIRNGIEGGLPSLRQEPLRIEDLPGTAHPAERAPDRSSP
jgi:hypothetical protein